MKPELILPAFLVLVALLTIAMTQMPMEHTGNNAGCQWCHDDAACRWADREKCR